jgi:hypothetical protein
MLCVSKHTSIRPFELELKEQMPPARLRANVRHGLTSVKPLSVMPLSACQ